MSNCSIALDLRFSDIQSGGLHYPGRNNSSAQSLNLPDTKMNPGTKINPELVAANAKFPAPKDITNLRSLIGLVNWFNDQNPDLKRAMVTWQGLLKKCNKYKWGDVQESH